MTAKIKQANKEKEASRRYIKFLSYFIYFYFGIRLILIPILFFMGGFNGLGINLGGSILTLILNLGFVILALICAYYLAKARKWALITLVALFSITIANSLLLTSSQGNPNIPLLQIAILIILLIGFKHLKNAK